MRPPSLRRTLLLWAVQWIHAWAERVLEQEGREGPAAPPPEPTPAESTFEGLDGPPAHWVERVRLGAPELLIGLDLRRAADDARPRHRAHAEAQGRTRTPAPERPRAAVASGRTAVSAAATNAVASAAAANRATIVTAAGKVATAEAVNAAMAAGAAPPRSQAAKPPGVLRWTGRARKLAERETIGSHRQPVRPEPPPLRSPRFVESSLRGPELPPDQAPAARPSDPVPSLPGEDPVRWPAAAGAPEVLPPLSRPPDPSMPPERWPDLPPDQAPGELEEGLLRRLERRRRVAREQRGD